MSEKAQPVNVLASVMKEVSESFWTRTSGTYRPLWSPVGQQMRQIRSLVGASLE